MYPLAEHLHGLLRADYLAHVGRYVAACAAQGPTLLVAEWAEEPGPAATEDVPPSVRLLTRAEWVALAVTYAAGEAWEAADMVEVGLRMMEMACCLRQVPVMLIAGPTVVGFVLEAPGSLSAAAVALPVLTN